MAVVMVIHLEGGCEDKGGDLVSPTGVQVWEGKAGGVSIYMHRLQPRVQTHPCKMEEQVKSCSFTKQNDVIFAKKINIYGYIFLKFPFFNVIVIYNISYETSE